MRTEIAGLLKIRVVKGTNLTPRDHKKTDPYVVVKLGNQVVKTRIIKCNINPVWNEELTLSITTAAAPGTLKVEVFDRHRFKADDKMGDAEIDLQPLVASVRMKKFLKGAKTATKVRKLVPSEDNYLAEESYIHYVDGDIVQAMCLRLDNLLYGDLYMQLKWVDLPGAGSGR